jgi:hypothetical protein
MDLIDLFFEDFDGHLVCDGEQNAILVAIAIAEAQAGIADATKENRGSTVITFGHVRRAEGEGRDGVFDEKQPSTSNERARQVENPRASAFDSQ